MLKLLLLASLPALVSFQSIPQLAQRVPKRPNFLIVVLDDVGTEKLGIYSEHPTNPSLTYPRTPELDALREQGILFTNAFVDPICSPTRACIQTGRYGFRTRIGAVVRPQDAWDLAHDEVTLAEMLAAGVPADPYASAAFGKWHLSNGSFAPNGDTHAVANGYDLYSGGVDQLADHYDWTRVRATPGNVQTTAYCAPPFDDPQQPTFNADVHCRDAVQWMNQQTGPFLAHVAFLPPHAPYQIPPFYLLSPETRAELQAQGLEPGDMAPPCTVHGCTGDPERIQYYDAMIEAVDTLIGRLLDGMSPAVRANTNILVIGDNGTDPAIIEDPPHDSTHAKYTVYNLGTRVPMIAAGAWVNAAHANSTCAGLVGAVDVWRTVADSARANLALANPAGHVLDSLSFLHLLANPALPSARTHAYSESFTPNGPTPPAPLQYTRAINDTFHKYMRLYPAQGQPGQYVERLYDISRPSYAMETEDLVPGLQAGTPDHDAYLSLRAAFDALVPAGS